MQFRGMSKNRIVQGALHPTPLTAPSQGHALFIQEGPVPLAQAGVATRDATRSSKVEPWHDSFRPFT